MDWIIRGRKELSCSYMEAGAAFLGEDILACIQGGDKPHIGCTVQAVPRPSLTGNGRLVNDGQKTPERMPMKPTFALLCTGLILSLAFY